MVVLEKGDSFINGTLSSNPAEVELVAHLIADILAWDHVSDTTKPVLVTRELLKNAVIHGNKGKAHLLVTFRLERPTSSRFRITVKDQGEGFDPAKVDLLLPHDPRYARSRGYAIIRSSSEAIEFTDNGATVTVDLIVGND